jgi:hypothetical protein
LGPLVVRVECAIFKLPATTMGGILQKSAGGPGWEGPMQLTGSQGRSRAIALECARARVEWAWSVTEVATPKQRRSCPQYGA